VIRSVLQSRISRSSSRSWIRPLDASPPYVWVQSGLRAALNPAKERGSPIHRRTESESAHFVDEFGVPVLDQTKRGHAPSDSGTLRPNYVFAGSHQPNYEGTKRSGDQANPLPR
jgi:hypothetical protein